MKRWIGRWIIGVATIHTIFAVIVFNETWKNILNKGVFNSVGDDPVIGAPVWFLLWGFLCYVLGFLTDELEKRDVMLPKSFGWGLLTSTIFGLVLMPMSGLWLLLLPSVSVIKGGGSK